MRIALIAPHPVPFGIGGAESLIWGLQDHLIDAAGHDCEIVTLVSPERTLDEVVASYEAFTRLDLGRFDCIVSGKYPAWMAAHDNHVVYMLHRLRGLYDTYPFDPASPPPASDSAPVAAFLDFLRHTRDAGAQAQDVDELFQRYAELKTADLPSALFDHPGPLARVIVHWLDAYGLAPERIRRYAAISDTVRRRRDYFPEAVPVDVLYPPPAQADYRCGAGSYLFTCSRLDGPKRVGLLVEAMAHVSADIPLLIAGTGPAEAELRRKAAGDRRIRFLGFVGDGDLPGLYADALAVPFVPYDEDYGLITIEAMKSGKPVLTTDDAGGPREFVTDGQTGYAVPPDPKALGARIEALAADPGHARQMGQAAAQRVAGINWQTVAAGLLAPVAGARAGGAGAAGSGTERRGKLTVAATFCVDPPTGGGQLRVFHLYRNIARAHDVDLVTLAPAGEAHAERQIAPGLKEIRVPRSPAHERHERAILETMGNVPIADVAAGRLAALTPDFDAALRYSAFDADAVIACHPYLLPAIRQAAPSKAIWYEAQDVEYDLKASAYAGKEGGAALLAEAARLEGMAWRLADLVFACAERDLDRLAALYGPTRAETMEVANGVDLADVAYTPFQTRRAARRSGMPAALFIASWHPPNIDAVETILACAPDFPDLAFLIAGTACLPFKDRALPDNVRMLGLVDAPTRAALFASADLALNPMRFGSGTNLKMLDYFAAGIPVVTTRFGMRGLAVEPDRHVVASADDDFAEGLRRALLSGPDRLEAMTRAARALVEAHYSWEAIAARFLKRCEARLGPRAAPGQAPGSPRQASPTGR